jgi:hypothetical protein
LQFLLCFQDGVDSEKERKNRRGSCCLRRKKKW